MRSRPPPCFRALSIRLARARAISVGSATNGSGATGRASFPASSPARSSARRAASPASSGLRVTAWNSSRALASSSPTSVSISIASRSMSSSVAGVTLADAPLARGAVRLPRDLDQQADARQRRAQLVRHRGQQLALLGQLSFQPHRHVVERATTARRSRRFRRVPARRAPRSSPAPISCARASAGRSAARSAARSAPRPSRAAAPGIRTGTPPARVRRQPRAPEVRRQQRRPDAEEDRRAEPVEEPAVKVRAVVEAHLVTDAASPAGLARARLAEHAVPRKRRALGARSTRDHARTKLQSQSPPR